MVHKPSIHIPYNPSTTLHTSQDNLPSPFILAYVIKEGKEKHIFKDGKEK